MMMGMSPSPGSYFHFPEATGNSAQAKDLTFTLCADATQTKNNPQRLFD